MHMSSKMKRQRGAVLSDECMCVCEKGNAYTHDEHVAFSRSSHALIPNRGNLQVSTTSEAWRAWRALESLLKVGEDIRTALELFGESPTFPRGFKNAPTICHGGVLHVYLHFKSTCTQ